MTEEQIDAICEYIRTHVPQATEIETIDVALRVITKDYSACTEEDLVNPDDAWLIPTEDRKKFAGVKTRGGAESLLAKDIQKILSAVYFAIDHEEEIRQKATLHNEIENKRVNNEINSMLSDINNENNNSLDKNDQDYRNNIL